MRISTSVHRVLAAMLSLAMAMALTIPAFSADGISVQALAAASFSDVPVSHTFYKGVMYCAGKGIVNGYPDGTFKPATTIAKNHFCAMLARAFYADQVANNDTDYYKKNYGTFGPTNYALAANGILNDSSFRRSYMNGSVMTTGINRYDMATLMTNIMNQKGFAASSAEKNAVISAIKDYADIPSQYKDAVANVYALGIIGGYGDGSFKGDNIMNRGQAAIVIQRMAQYAPVKGDDDNNQYDNGQEKSNTGGNTETTTPAPKLETPKPMTVNVTSAKTDNGTAWMVPDNKFVTGYLNNGKAVTQTNVEAMLADAEKIWPDGITWTVQGASGNNYYGNKGAIADGYTAWQIIHGANRTDANYACGGFACMLSDYIFGPNASNPCRKLDDNTKVRPGDIVITTLNGTTKHVMIATSTVWYKSGRPGVFTADGNVSNVVSWNAENGIPIDSYTNSAGTAAHIIYTRYPD